MSGSGNGATPSVQRSEFRLSVPVEAHGEEISVLRLRRPRAQDLADCGMPFRFDGNGVMDINAGNMLALAAKLAGVPPSTIGALDVSDFIELQGTLATFFGKRPEIPDSGSTRVLTSPTTGNSTPEPSSNLLGESSSYTPNRRRA